MWLERRVRQPIRVVRQGGLLIVLAPLSGI